MNGERKESMKKRIISFLMCLVMAFSIVPAAAWAEVLPSAQDAARVYVNSADTAIRRGAGTAVSAEEAKARIGEEDYYASLPKALEAAENGDTVTLLADHEEDVDAIMKGDLSTMAVVKKRLTLDLNGFSVDYLTVGNKAIVGEPTYDEETGEEIAQVAITAGDLTVVDRSQGASGSIAELEFISGRLELKSGIIGEYSDGTYGEGITCAGGRDNENVTDGTYDGEITVTGGTVYSLYAKENVTVTVTGGSGHKGNWSNDTGKMTITGGSFADAHFSNNGGTIAISGGAFESITNNDASAIIPLMPLLADGYAFFDKDGNVLNGTAKTLTDVEVKRHTHSVTGGVCPCGAEFVASVTHDEATAYYTTLQSAFDNAQDYDTITLLTDVALTKPLSIELNWTTGADKFTLDLNGRTISCDNGETNTIYVSNARLTICDSSSEKTGKVTQNAAYAVWVESSGTLTITGGSFGMVRVGSMGRAVIGGGSFSAIDSSDSSGSLADLLADGYAFYDQSSGEVQNGTATKLTNVTVKKHTHSGKPCACGYTCPNTTDMDATGHCATCGELLAQASVTVDGNTTYDISFKNAVENAADGATVTLLQDVTLPDGDEVYINKAYDQQISFAIDWNGHTLSGRHYAYLLTISGAVNMTLKDSGGNGGVRNEYAIDDYVGGTAVHVSVQSGYCVTIEGGTYSAQVVKYNCSGDLRIKGGVFQNPERSTVRYAIFSCDRNKIDTGALADLLADGYTFSYSANAADTERLLDVYTNAHTEAGKTVYVVSHTHAYDSTTGKCACGKPCAHTLDETGKCTTCGATFVAQVNGDYYTTVTEALDKASSGGTVTLLSNAVTENVTFAGGDKSVTLDMAGKTLTAADTDHPALTVESGTLTVSGDAAFISQGFVTMLSSDTQPAILVTGGKLVFTGALTAVGGWSGNAMSSVRRQFAVKATGGELDFKGGLDLKGGLAVLGTAVLTNKLTQGTFWIDRSKDENEVPVYAIIAVETKGTDMNKTYRNVRALLADGHAFAKVDSGEIWGVTALSCSDNVTIVPHEHTWEADGELYTCTVCGETCAHEGGYKTGACTVCGKPCPHALADQSTVDHNYYCKECGVQMFARIEIRAYNWAHFTSLADAMAAAKDGQTVTLLSDIDQDEQSADIIVNGKTVTLDLNGKTITGGWIYVGDNEQPTTATLKIIGSGSFVLPTVSGVLTVHPGGTLDLSGWTGGTLTRVQIDDSSDASEDIRKKTSLIVGERAGTIEELDILNWQLGAADTANAINLGGGSYGKINMSGVSGGSAQYLAVGSLLASGYAFKDTDGYVRYDREITKGTNYAGSISDVTVVQCDHSGLTALPADGKCPYCNVSGFVAMVETSNGVLTAFTDAQTAFDEAEDGETVTLLEGVTDNAVIDKAVTVDLNGKNMSTVTVSALAKFKNSGATGGQITSLTIDSADAVLGDLLADGYSLKNRNTGEWLSASELLGTSASNVTVAETAVSSVNIRTSVRTVYGVSANLGLGVGGYPDSYQWYERKNGTWTPIADATEGAYKTPADQPCGDYTYRCVVTGRDAAAVFSDVLTLTVEEADFNDAVVELEQSELTYALDANGSPATQSVHVKSVKIAGVEVPKDAYTVEGAVSASIAGTNYIYIKAAQSAVNYTGVKEVKWKIIPLELDGIYVDNNVIKTYDGKPVDLNTSIFGKGTLVFTDVSGNHVTLSRYRHYSVQRIDHSFTSANAGSTGDVTVWVDLYPTGDIIFRKGTTSVQKGITLKNMTIGQASLQGPVTVPLQVVNGVDRDYTLDILAEIQKKLPVWQSCGDVTYSLPMVDLPTEYYEVGRVSIDKDGVLTLPIHAETADTVDDIGTVTVTASTQNYGDITVTVNVSSMNKSAIEISKHPTATPITYGQMVKDSQFIPDGVVVTGEDDGLVVDGEFRWKAEYADEKPEPASCWVEYEFIPTGENAYKYKTGGSGMSIKVNPALLTDVSVEQTNELTYTGKPQTATVKTTAHTVDNWDERVTFYYGLKEWTGAYGEFRSDVPAFTEAGAHTVYYHTLDGALHHEIATGSFTVTIAPKTVDAPTIELSESVFTYTGEAFEPTVVIKDGDTVIPAGEYTVSYKDNTDAGTATVVIEDKPGGNYAVSGTASFKIEKANAKLLTPPTANTLTYTGTEQALAAAGTAEGGWMRYSLDDMTYEIDIPTGTDAGTYTVWYTVIGDSNHNSTRDFQSFTVTIAPKTVDAPVIEVSGAPFAYTGKAIEPTVIVKDGGTVIPAGEYTVSCRDNTGVGTAAVTITDKTGGNYTVSGTASFAIDPAKLTNVSVTAPALSYNGKAQTPDIRAAADTVDGSPVTVTYSETENGVYTETIPSYSAVGSYELYYRLTAANHETVSGSLRITVQKSGEPSYTVSGEVKQIDLMDRGQPGSPVEGAEVTIRRGLEVIGGRKTTDADGRFDLDGVPAGVYNVVVEYHDRVITQMVKLVDHNVTGLPVGIPLQDVNSELAIRGGSDLTNGMVVGGLDDEAANQFPDSGGSVSVSMDIRERSADRTDPVQRAIRGKAGGMTLDFVDMTLLLVRDGVSSDLAETKGLLEIIISYDTSRRGITVLRSHNGEVQTLEACGPTGGREGYYVDKANGCIHIFAQKFSTYAIGYTTGNDKPDSRPAVKEATSPATGDAGLVGYAAMALSSCTGTALLLRRKREHE